MTTQRIQKLAVVGHPLAAEENRMAFRDWTAFQVDLVLPEVWNSRSLGHVYRGPGQAAALSSAPDAVASATGSDLSGPRLHPLPTLASGRNSLFLWKGLASLLERLQPDLIYCWEEPWCLSTWQVCRLARRMGVPLVFYSAENRPKRLPWPFGALMRRVFSEARACVTPTAEIAETVRAAGFPGPALVIPLWIRSRRSVTAKPGNRTLAYVGRLIALKRVHLIIESLALLPGYRLRILGDGPERGRLEALAARLGVADRTDFLGHVDNASLEASLEGASLLLLPTGENPRQAEQFGKAALEAVSCGLPVLASRTGNLALLADTLPTMTACDLDTPGQMAAAVSAAMAAYPEPAALSEARDRVAGRFGPAAAGRGLEASFASLSGKAEIPAAVREALG